MAPTYTGSTKLRAPSGRYAEKGQINLIFLYILGVFLLILVVCGVAGLIFFKFTVGRRDSWRMPDEKIMGDGARKALLLYQPSNGGHNVPLAHALAQQVAKQGYTVVMNHPSERLTYNLEEYDLLLFGTPSYLGETSKALRSYIKSHPVWGKHIFLFVTGGVTEAPELESLKSLFPVGNELHGIKITTAEKARLLDFAKARIN